MRLFVSYNLSSQYYDMALIDDEVSWLGSSVSFPPNRPVSVIKVQMYLSQV